jgi:hypothetical protein
VSALKNLTVIADVLAADTTAMVVMFNDVPGSSGRCTMQIGAFVVHAALKFSVHALGDAVPVVIVPTLSLPTIDGDVPQDESDGVLPSPYRLPTMLMLSS